MNLLGTAAALRIIAAVKCGHIDIPAGWRDMVLKHVFTLEYWEMEAPDFGKAVTILRELLSEI